MMNTVANTAEIVDLYNAGLLKRDIAKRLNISRKNVMKRLEEAGIPRRNRVLSRRDISTEELIHVYQEEGLSIRELARRYGLDRNAVLNRFKRARFTPRTPTEAMQLALAKGKCNHIYKRGEEACAWRGGKGIDSEGYVRVHRPEHPRAEKNGYVREHILVWEQYHQRKVPKGYVIHHLNGIKVDNRPENLVAMPKGKHMVVHNNEPYKKRIRQLEIENRQLRKALEDSQLIFYAS